MKPEQNKDFQEILSILKKRSPTLSSKLEGVRSLVDLSRNVREQVVSELEDEFSEKGLQVNDEPNSYGLRLEALIDACGLSRD